MLAARDSRQHNGEPMPKRDLKKELKTLYAPSAKAVGEIVVPPMQYLMLDGEGDPNTAQSYKQAVEALFTAAYAIKFLLKKSNRQIDYGVMPLESLWWSARPTSNHVVDKSGFQWTAMILQPDFVTSADISEGIAIAKRKKPALAALSALRHDCLDEGQSAQILHIGPFSAEGPAIDSLHDYIAQRGKPTGKHHEIYLSDITKTSPERWKTVIRQPFR